MLLQEDDFSEKRPLILTNGWLLSDARVDQLPTYIGEFPNLQRGDHDVSPHGEATYQMVLCYDGNPIEVSMSFPQLFSLYTIFLDDQPLAQNEGAAKLSFTLTPGNHLLTVKTISTQGYYSGMYHPPMLGSTQSIFRCTLISCIAYGVAFFAPLALALFTITLWRTIGNQLSLWFGRLCGCFSMYVSYYFIRLLNFPIGQLWYLAQSLAFYGLCFCVLRLTAIGGNMENTRISHQAERALLFFSCLLLFMALLIPIFPGAVVLHGILTDFYYIFTFCALLLLGLRGNSRPHWEGLFTRLACVVFGGGLLLNLFGSNLFEPILFFWQFEWCGIFLVILFGAVMAAQNRRILAENAAFSEHLEDLVLKRTEELQNLLKERKAFFADMAHDLKAPIYATQTFIRAIQENNTGVDTELQRYINEVEQKQTEIARRVQSLTAFDKLDTLNQPVLPVSIQKTLLHAFDTHHMAAEVAAIYLVIEPPETDAFLLSSPRKLASLLDNLIVNALHATPPGGKVTISAELDEAECHLTVADTGSGIPLEELPHIFDRFFVGKENKETGSGIGLYIVKTIVEDLKGDISVSSKPGQGAVFYIDLPLICQED